MFDRMVDNVIHAVDRQQIPAGQYQAVLIDEGHDFKPEWFKLVTQMVDPRPTACWCCTTARRTSTARQEPQVQLQERGHPGRGPHHILKINYRNTKQILQTANLVAAEFLQPDAQDEDGTPLVQPVSCGREGPAP
jgi:superfamily I DNA and RNA helicase